jgi:polyphosphate kinase 2 (PPK2 family)
VYTFAAPDQRELRHHFLWRFQSKVPGMGGMCVFDRSWYGRLLVERVEGFATHAQWTRAFDEIVQFERGLVQEGLILVKFWMQVSPDEQLTRFTSRGEDPLRSWKLTDEDWRNRDKREQYDEAAEDMFEHTDHALAPWDLIAGDQKKWARVAVLETVIKRVEQGLELWKE